MTKRSSRPVLTEQRKGIEEAKLQALKQAANQGWSDITAGRYTDVADDQLEDFIGRLGGPPTLREPNRSGSCRDPL